MKKLVLAFALFMSLVSFSQTPEVLFSKANNLYKNGSYTKAIELDLKPSGYYYSIRADAKEKLEDYRGAILDYNKAIELEPESYYYYNYSYFYFIVTIR